MKTNIERRAFFRRAAVLSVGFVFAGRLGRLLPMANAASKKEEPLPTGEKPVDENDVLAKAMKFKQAPKKGENKPGQSCGNCQLNTKVNESWGHCQLLQGKGVVSSKGWCASWSKKEKA
jgi:hypothetical protein